MTFSEKLKKLRREKGITQNELADAIFISRSMIAKYESGLAYPTRENAEKLASFFDVALWLAWKFDKNGKRQYVLFITASILFVIIIFLIVLTFVFAANYSKQTVYGGYKSLF